MPSDIPFYEEIILGCTFFSIGLNGYIVFLIFNVMPKSMRDFRQCLFLLSLYDALLALLMGPILNVMFQAPALAAVFKGPIIMFIYNNFGYNACRAVTGFLFYTLVAIISYQNYGVFFRFFAILPNQKYYECWNSIPGFVYIYSICNIPGFMVGVLAYLLLCDEKELPTEMLKYKNPSLTFIDFIPGQSVLVICKQNSDFWYVLVSLAGVGFLYIECNSYTMFFIAKRTMKKYASKFTKQTYNLHRQFLYLLMVQITMPVFLIVAPLTWLICQRTFNVEPSKWQTDIVPVSGAVYSFINGLMTVFYISPFRKFTKRITVDVVLKRFGIKSDDSQRVSPAATTVIS